MTGEPDCLKSSLSGWETADHWCMFIEQETPDGLRTESVQLYPFRGHTVLFVRGYNAHGLSEIAIPLSNNDLQHLAVAAAAISAQIARSSDGPS